jgi:hypothetical protein
MSISLSQIDSLDRSMPAAKRAGLGTKLADLIVQFNALRQFVSDVHYTGGTILTAAFLEEEAAHKLVETTAEFSALVEGKVIVKAAGTNMPTLATGNLATGKAAAYYFDMDSAGTITCTKTADANTKALAIASLPAVAVNTVRVGYIVVENGTDGNFVGNTTDLNAADITVTYVNTPALASLAATAVETLT